MSEKCAWINRFNSLLDGPPIITITEMRNEYLALVDRDAPGSLEKYKNNNDYVPASRETQKELIKYFVQKNRIRTIIEAEDWMRLNEKQEFSPLNEKDIEFIFEGISKETRLIIDNEAFEPLIIVRNVLSILGTQEIQLTLKNIIIDDEDKSILTMQLPFIDAYRLHIQAKDQDSRFMELGIRQVEIEDFPLVILNTLSQAHFYLLNPLYKLNKT